MLINKNPGNMPLVPQRTPHDAKSAAAAVGRRDAYQNQSQGDEQQLGGDDEDFGASMHMTALNRHSSLEKEKGPAEEQGKRGGKRGSLVITSLTRNLSAEKGERNHNSSLNSHASQSSWQTSKNLRGVGGGVGGGGAGRASGNFVEKVVRRCSGDLLSSGLAQNYPDSAAAGGASGGGGGGGGGAANLVQTMRRFGNRGSIGHDEKKDDASAAANAKGGQVGDKECEATRQLNELNDMMAELRRENKGAYIGAAQLRHMAVQRIHENKERRRMSAEQDGSGKPRRSKSVDALERLRNLAGGGEGDGGGDAAPRAAGRRASNEEKDGNLRGSRGRARGRARGRRGSSNFCCDGEDTRRRSTSADALKRLSMLVGGNENQAAGQSGGGGMEWGARHDSKSDFDFASYAVSGAGAGGGEAVARRRRGHRGSLGRVSERGGGNEGGGAKESPNRMPRARSADGLKQLAGLFGGEEKDKKLESPAPQKQHVIMRRGSDLVIQTPMFERGSLEDDDSSESGSEDEEEDKKGEATDGGKKMFPWQQEVAPAANDGGGRGDRRGRGGGNSSKIKPSGSFESITRLAGMLSNGMAAERREEDFALLARRQQTNAARRGNMMASNKRSSMPMAEQPSEMNERQRKEAQWKASLGFGPPVVDQHPHPRPGGEAVELQERPRRAEATQEDAVEDEETKMRLLEVEREREEEMEYLYKLRPAARGGRANSGGAIPVSTRPAPRGGRTRSGGTLSGGGLPSQADTNTAPIQGSAELDYEQQLLLATHRGGGAPHGGGGGRVVGGGVLKGSSEPIAVHPSELAHRPNQRRPGGLKSALKGSSEPVAIAPSELFAQRRYEGGLEAENRRASDGFGQRGSMVGEPEHRRASDGCVPENRRGSAGWATGGDAGRQLPYGVNVPKGYSEPSEPIPVHRPFERANRSAVQDPLRPQAVQAPMKTEDGSGGKEEKGGWRNLVRRLSGDAKNSTVVRGMEEDGGARDATTAGGAPPEAQELRRRESLQKMSSVRRNRLSDGGRFLDLTQDRRYSEHALGCDSEDENSDPRRPSVTKDGGVYEIDTATGDGHGGKMKKTYSEEELKSVDTSVAGEDYYGYPGMIPDDDSGAEEDRFGVSRWNESGLMSEIDRRRYSRRRSSIHSSGAASDGAAEEPTPWETLAKDFEDDGLGDGHPSGNGAAEDRLNASSKWHESGLMSEADRRQYRRRRSSVHSSGALSDGAGDEPSPWENLGEDGDGGADKTGNGDNNGSSGAFEAFDLDEY